MADKYLSYKTLKNNLRQITRGCWNPSSKHWSFSDSKFYLPTKDEIDTILTAFKVKINSLNLNTQGLDESFDCDDYAFLLKGEASLTIRKNKELMASICMGIAWGEFSWVSEYHACNWVMDSDHDFHWIEPQDSSMDSSYRCKDGITLILV